MNAFLNIQNISVEYRPDGKNGKNVKIVDDLSLKLNKGEIFGIIGESGCGKSTLALAIANLLPDNFHITAGLIEYLGEDLTKISNNEYLKLLGEEIGFIFQDPMTSLNPLLKIGYQISERLHLHSKLNSAQITHRTLEVMQEVGLANASHVLGKYPHELSGGMRQRVMIAIALVNKPNLIIADEPTTSLDPTIQAQILQLLHKIKENYKCTIIFISHDFGVINQLCDKVAVMYAGELVEIMEVANLFKNAMHPYTKGLINSIPSLQKRGQPLYCIPGSVLALENKLSGCAFAERCLQHTSLCTNNKPVFMELGQNHLVKCHLSGKLRL